MIAKNKINMTDISSLIKIPIDDKFLKVLWFTYFVRTSILCIHIDTNKQNCYHLHQCMFQN